MDDTIVCQEKQDLFYEPVFGICFKSTVHEVGIAIYELRMEMYRRYKRLMKGFCVTEPVYEFDIYRLFYDKLGVDYRDRFTDYKGEEYNAMYIDIVDRLELAVIRGEIGFELQILITEE